MADRTVRILLEIMALDKATTVLKAMMDSLQGWADRVNGVGEQVALTDDQIAAAQVRLQGASDAYDVSLEAQATALGRLEGAQGAVVTAQQAAIATQLEAQQAAVEAAAASDAESASAQAYAATAARAAAEAATAVKLSVDEQILAYDKLMTADALVEKRSAQVAAVQVASNEESSASTTTLGKLAPAALAVGAAMGYITVKSAEAAANFQTVMTKLVTSAGQSAAGLAAVGQQVLQISDQTGLSAVDLGKALYYVDSANYHDAQSTQILAAAAKGARDEMANVSDVTNALTTVMVNYGMKSDQATTVMNQMIMAVSMGKTNLQEFSVALAQVLPVGAAAGVSFNEIAAALSMMTARGTTAQQAATDLAFAIRNMEKPNGQAIAEMEQLGLKSTDVEQSLGKNGLVATFEMLHNAVISHMGPAGLVVMNAFNQSQTAAAKAKEMFDSLPSSLQGLATQMENGSISAHQWTLAIRNLSDPQQKLMQQFATLYTNSQSFNTMLKSNATPAAQAYTGAMSQMMGGAAALQTMLEVTSKGSLSDFATSAQKIADVSKQANGDVVGWSDVQATFNQRLAEAKQTLINTGIAIGTALLPYLTKFLSAVTGFLAPLAQFIQQHRTLSAIIFILVGALSALIGVTLVVVKIAGLVEAAMYALGDALDFIIANPIVLVLAAIAIAAYLIVTHWSTVKRWIEDFWNWLKKTAEEAWNFIKAHVNEVAAALVVLGGPLGILVAAALEIITHWSKAKKWLSDFWSWLKDAASDTAGFFRRIWDDVIGWFEGVWDGISKPITKEWGRVSTDLSQIWSELITLWNDTGGKLVSLISRNWGTISAVVNEIWQPIVLFFKTVWSLIWNNISFFLGLIENGLKVAWNTVKAVTKTTWDWIQGYTQAVWDFIWGIIKGAADIIGGILKVLWDIVTTTVKTAWDIVTGIINTALDFIKDILKVFIDVVTGKWGQAWNDIKKTFEDVWNNVKDFARNILNDIVNFFTSAALDLYHGFLSGIESIAGGVWNALVDLWNTITRFFSNVGSWLWNTGTQLIQGLINGIENWASHLWDTLSNLASGILSKIGKFLGLGSPSRYTHQYGQYLVEGLVNGINASAQKAAGAARSLAQGVLSATGGTLGTVTLAAGGVGNGALFAGAAGSAAARPTVNVTNDLRGAQIAGPASINWITDQINRNFVQKVAPTAGVVTRRTGG